MNGSNGSKPRTSSLTGNPEEDNIILHSFDYIRSLPGKQVRSKLSVAFNYWLKVEPEILDKVCDIVELLHNASLLIDDIEDGSELRRGHPAAHAIFGIPQTINAANYVYFIALERSLALKHPNAVAVFTEQLLELHRGQGMEMYWRDSFICPSEQQYTDTIVKKTGGLFMLAIRLLQLFSNDHRDLKKLVSLLGLFFQIRDDYANLMLAEYCENKSFCEDLTEGKFSFPVIHAMNKHPEDTQIACILRQRTKSHDLKKHFVLLLQKFGSLDYTQEKLKSLAHEIRAEIVALGGNPYLESLVEELVCKIFQK
ncbi:geranylgeranyl pyrophosphate synthase [Folsomia candida]|uniref:Geranylgeranyl pyrophosphate synthase n=1 Tax=Folsomia candida TaxID=158441 RepID=A0A226DFL6_FOLCA|nr:geranylgeranyl pyrophosphate synthase [Folsomia candida]XP_035714818.1 geranylgeranyl pyrophosphate synthase [Folsomia candida]OXA43487.1 Geranylgeranyl pyrophosphate synthase [Folsomia candida]